jgi:hypothetical protein
MQLALRGDRECNPLDNAIPLDRSSTHREHGSRRAPAPRSNQAKIGEEERAVNPKTLCHQ